MYLVDNKPCYFFDIRFGEYVGLSPTAVILRFNEAIPARTSIPEQGEFVVKKYKLPSPVKDTPQVPDSLRVEAINALGITLQVEQ